MNLNISFTNSIYKFSEMYQLLSACKNEASAILAIVWKHFASCLPKEALPFSSFLLSPHSVSSRMWNTKMTCCQYIHQLFNVWLELSSLNLYFMKLFEDMESVNCVFMLITRVIQCSLYFKNLIISLFSWWYYLVMHCYTPHKLIDRPFINSLHRPGKV